VNHYHCINRVREAAAVRRFVRRPRGVGAVPSTGTVTRCGLRMMSENGGPKIVCNADAPDKATYIITGEDHTLGNALRYMLIRK
jgi:hypothetical protein